MRRQENSCGRTASMRASAGAAAPRGLSGRGLAYWSDGKQTRIFYVTPGYRLLSLDAKTGSPSPGFGDNGIVDLKENDDHPINLNEAEIGLQSAPVVAKDVVLVGAAFLDGAVPLRCEKRQAPLDFPYHPDERRVRLRYVAQQFGGIYRQRRRLGSDHCGGGTGTRLPAGRTTHVRLLWGKSPRSGSVRREPRVCGSQDRKAEVALPIGPPWHVGHGHPGGAYPG